MAAADTALLPFLTLLCFLTTTLAQYPPMTLTIVNNCPYPLWPAIQPNGGHQLLENGGFFLPSLSHRSFPAPAQHWTGRIWARTGCSSHPSNPSRLACATGDCGGRLECAGAGGAAPATLAQITLHHGGAKDLTSYGVSLVDGFNVPMTVTPHEGAGVCPVVGCKADLVSACPAELQMRAAARGPVVGCKSGCQAFGTDELCCRNKYNSPQTCRASSWSQYFKRACPATFTFAHDNPSLAHDCSAPKELKVIFCH